MSNEVEHPARLRPERLAASTVTGPPRWWAMTMSRPAVGLLAAALLLALTVRTLWLWPPAQTVSQSPYDDEGVYVMAAQLLRQGFWPYRDYFFAHPPLGIVSLLPAVSVAYTPWGSSLSFGLARLLMAAMGTATVALVGLTGWRLWGPVGGLVAALIIAIDPASIANSRHILLEVPMVLLGAASLLVALPRPPMPRSTLLAGLLAGLAALVKLQALTLAVALIAGLALGRQWRRLAWLVGGLGLALSLMLPVALLAGPDRMLRQLLLFQLLRPPDGLETLPERLAALLAPTGLLFPLCAAALGLLGLGLGRVGRHAAEQPSASSVALPLLLWIGLGLTSFLISRSYYQHYASQLTPALAVLAGAVALPLGRWSSRRRLLSTAAAGLLLLGLAGPGLLRVLTPRPDPMFVVVARYITDAVPVGGAALTTDVQFNYLAARAMPQTERGFLVDSYGQLVYTGLGLADGSLGEAMASAVANRVGASVHEIMWRPAAQAVVRQQAQAARVVVIHAVGRGRLTPETTAWLREQFQLVESNSRYDIYRRRSEARGDGRQAV